MEKNSRFLTIISYKPGGRRSYSVRSVEILKRKQLRQKATQPEAALAWMDAFKAQCRVEKKAVVPAAGTTPADLQVTDQVLFHCGVKSLMKVKQLVAPTEVETMAFNEIETVLENYLQPRKRLVIAE